MQLVVDSSVVVGICLAGGELGPLGGHQLSAPGLLPAEVTSSLREASFRGDIAVGRAREAVAHLGSLSIDYAAPGSLADAAFGLAVELGWAKTYDAEYIVLAQSLAAPLVTLDARLARGAARVVEVLGPTEVTPEH